MTDNVISLPDATVSLDLDVIERDPKEVKPPFVVKVGDRNVTMRDPEELDWRDLLTIQQPLDFLQIAMSGEDRRYLNGLELPAWKFSRIIDAYYAHYDLEAKVERAQRQARLSGNLG